MSDIDAPYKHPSFFNPFVLLCMAGCSKEEIPQDIKKAARIVILIIAFLSAVIGVAFVVSTLVIVKFTYNVKFLKNASLLANNILKISLLALLIFSKIFLLTTFVLAANLFFVSILKRKNSIEIEDQPEVEIEDDEIQLPNLNKDNYKEELLKLEELAKNNLEKLKMEIMKNSNLLLSDFVKDLTDDKEKKDCLLRLGEIYKKISPDYKKKIDYKKIDSVKGMVIPGAEDIKNISWLLTEMYEFNDARNILEILRQKNYPYWKEYADKICDFISNNAQNIKNADNSANLKQAPALFVFKFFKEKLGIKEIVLMFDLKDLLSKFGYSKKIQDGMARILFNKK